MCGWNCLNPKTGWFRYTSNTKTRQGSLWITDLPRAKSTDLQSTHYFTLLWFLTTLKTNKYRHTKKVSHFTPPL